MIAVAHQAWHHGFVPQRLEGLPAPYLSEFSCRNGSRDNADMFGLVVAQAWMRKRENST